MFIVCMLAISLAGCATTKKTATPELGLQQKVQVLEENLAKKDQEISDLKYQVDDLNFKMQNLKKTESSSTEWPSVSITTDSSKSDDIVRVNADPKDIQTALSAAGYYQGAIDGKIGQKSQKAIKDFQKDHGLKADGVIGQKTWAELKTYLK